MKSSSSAADRRHCRAVAAARAATQLLIERYGFSRHGHAAGVTNFCGLHANVHGEMHRVVQGVASISWRVSIVSAGQRAHLVLGRFWRRPRHRAYKMRPTICWNQKSIFFPCARAAW